MERQDLHWGELTRQYAMCARHFSEAVALLGSHRDVGLKTLTLWRQIKELHAACLPIEKQIDRLLDLDEGRIGAGGYDQPPQ